MKAYAYVYDGEVVEVIHGAMYEAPSVELRERIGEDEWNLLEDRTGREIPISERFTPEFIRYLVEVDPENVRQGMRLVDGEFVAGAVLGAY